jgi:hypothetical protein
MTIVSLKEYFDRVMLEKDKALQAALASAKEAVTIAEANSEKWRANANEWRAAMSDRDKLYMLKSEFTTYKEATEKILDELRTYKAIAESKASSWLVWVGLFFTGAGFFFSLIGLLISFYVVFIK